jgi:hypothetical protein
MSVSLRFFDPFEQLNGPQWSVARQFELLQSSSDWHVAPPRQGGQSSPPQSTSVSWPSWVPFSHEELKQAACKQLLVAGQSSSTLQATHEPDALQTLPPFVLHAVPAGAATVPQVPPSHVASSHAFVAAGQSAGWLHSSIIATPPAPLDACAPPTPCVAPDELVPVDAPPTPVATWDADAPPASPLLEPSMSGSALLST